MIAQSQSGTGKTAAFVLSMLSRVDATKSFTQVRFAMHCIMFCKTTCILGTLRIMGYSIALSLYFYVDDEADGNVDNEDNDSEVIYPRVCG